MSSPTVKLPAAEAESAIAKARRAYGRMGYPRHWIDRRLRAVVSRHEVTREWSQRGARSSDDYRRLTNDLFVSAFGRDVAGVRAAKGLTGDPSANLRDHMTDAELMWTSLGESAAALLSRDRGSRGVEQLSQDATAAGEVVTAARAVLDRHRAAR